MTRATLAPMRRPALVLALLFGLSLPFLGKPVHLDDANFLRLAEGARLDPWRPHAVSINWQGTTERAFDVLSNPPGLAWWLAPVLDLPVWGLHLWMLLWLPLAAWGAWTLGERFASRGAEATVLLVGGPLAALAAQSLMPDLPLYACALAGLAGVVRDGPGPPRRRWPWALLAGCAALFRYSGATLIPLVALWALLQRDRRGALLLPLAAAAPLALLVLHDLHAYGQVHLLAMVGFQGAEGAAGRDVARKGIAAVAMLGGVGVIPLLGRGLPRWVGALVGLGLGGWGAGLSGLDGVPHIVTVLAGGAGGAALGACARRLDRDAAWLLVWLLGGLVFLLQLRFLAGRYWLPFLAPAVLLPLAVTPRSALRWACALTPLLTLLLSRSDHRLAVAQERLAAAVLERADGEVGLIAGHWGFQHHLEAAGWTPLDDDAPVPPGALLAVSAVAWPQTPEAGACLTPVARFQEHPFGLLPRVHTAAGGANVHAFVVSGQPPVETYAPWSFGTDPLDTVALWRGCAPSE